MSTIQGTVWWSELMTRDVAASRSFYEATCGWAFETADMPDGPYHLAMAHGRPVAGMMDMEGMPGMEGVPAHWFTYFAVDDLDEALAKAKAQGGKILRPPFEVPDTGTIAIVEDAGGAALGLMVPVTGWDAGDAGTGAPENVPL